MYGFGEDLTKENILKRISSYDIFKYYCEPFSKVGKGFCSELRVDNKPSSCIAQIKGDLLYTDFGTGESYRCFDYVMVKLGLSFREALEKINLDFNLKLGCYGITNNISNDKKTKPLIQKNIKFEEKSPTIIKIKRRNWEEHDKEYWYGKYYISEEVLNSFNVVPISHFWINDNIFIADKYSYCYNFYWEEDNSVFYRKIYQPYNKRLKWISNGGLAVQGEGMLPKEGNLLIITKALKDIIVLYNLGYTAIAPVSESTFLSTQYFFKQYERFGRVELFFDSDSTGLKKAQEFSEKFKIPYKFIPLEYNIKDISDFVELKGIEESKILLKKLFAV
jgi:hypothetical protein